MDIKTVLNEEQLQAVEHDKGPLLIIAGAGTGKTTVITERIKHLIIKKNILPSQILALTFTEKAAREMEERVDVAMPYGYTENLWISTFHAFCDRILRNEAIHIGLNPSYKLASEAEIVLFLRQNLFKFRLSYFRPLGNPFKFIEGMLQHFSRLADEDVSPSQYLHWAKTQNKKEASKNLELANAYKTYSDLKIHESIMDFADLISNTLKLFRERETILRRYQEQFKYILVDEFQDTNFAQNQLATMLSGAKKNITVVGDDDQAIYRWRGAAISNMVQFRENYKKIKVVTLTKNYRSTSEILDKSYVLIQNNNPDRLEVKENISKKLIAAKKIKGQNIEFLFADRVENEAELVAKKIQLLIENENLSFKDFAILVRANDHSASFVRAFQRFRIPYQFLGPGRLFHQEEIKDLISYLKVLYNFEDSVSLYRVLNLPIFNFEARDIAAFLNLAKRKNLSLFETLEKIIEEPTGIFIKDSIKVKVKDTLDMIKRHLKLVPKESAGQILYYFLEDSGMLKKFLSTQTLTDEKKYQNIARFFDKLKTFEIEHDDNSVFAVVDWIEILMQMGESPLSADTDWGDVNAVNILTIHSSKGLEFPVVFLVNLVSQRFPTRQRSEQIPIPQELIKEILPIGDYHIQEERRLFYVGMTRACTHLYFTAARFYGEGKRERKISPFVYETLSEKEVNTILDKEKVKESVNQLSLLEWSQKLAQPTTGIPISDKRQATSPLSYLSYSMLSSFDLCPLHYKLKYILKIPTPPSSSQSFGISMHSALRNFYQEVLKGEKMNIKDVERILKSVWIDEGYQSKSHKEAAYTRALNLLNIYFEKYYTISNSIKPIGLEIPFQFLIKHPQTNQFLKIGGRIDRVDKIDDKTIEIIDYKTGTNIKDENELSSDLQLTIYALAANLIKDDIFNKKANEIVLSLHYIEEDKKITTTRTAEQLEEARLKLFDKSLEITKSEYLCSGSSFCLNCEYKMLCHV